MGDFNNLRAELDSRVDRNYTLDNFGISKDDFISDFKEQLLDRIYQIGAEKAYTDENNSE